MSGTFYLTVMHKEQPNNPLHGVTLAAMLDELVERHGWDGLAARVKIHCFANDPSIKSSLKFLRRMEWARKEVEALYLHDLLQRRGAPSRPETESGDL
jgi:uncharacterized protein (DUF2132 family)